MIMTLYKYCILLFIIIITPQSTYASCHIAVARVASGCCGGTSTNGGTPAVSLSTEDAGATATCSRRDSNARTNATRRPAPPSSVPSTASTVCNSARTDVRSANALILVRCGKTFHGSSFIVTRYDSGVQFVYVCGSTLKCIV